MEKKKLPTSPVSNHEGIKKLCLYSIYNVLDCFILSTFSSHLLIEITGTFRDLLHGKFCNQFCNWPETRYCRAISCAHFYILVCQNTFNFKIPLSRKIIIKKKVAHFQCLFSSCHIFWKYQQGCQLVGVKIDFVMCFKIISVFHIGHWPTVGQ